MSAIFSDPQFRRGTTLLGGELIELDGSGNPVAGGEIVGQVKAFQDVNPSTGVRNSNRLVYCVAARYKGSTVSDGSTIAGLVYALDAAAPLTEFTSVATNANVAAGRTYGVVDEYLTGQVRQNDIIWLVVKGPTSIQSSGTAIAAGAAIEVTGSAGQVTTKSSGVAIGCQIAGSSVGGTAGALVRANVTSDVI